MVYPKYPLGARHSSRNISIYKTDIKISAVRKFYLCVCLWCECGVAGRGATTQIDIIKKYVFQKIRTVKNETVNKDDGVALFCIESLVGEGLLRRIPYSRDAKEGKVCTTQPFRGKVSQAEGAACDGDGEMPGYFGEEPVWQRGVGNQWIKRPVRNVMEQHHKVFFGHCKHAGISSE